MDPYLERHWGDVHTRLITYMSDALNPQISPALRSRVEERLILESDDDEDSTPRRRIPDVRMYETRFDAAVTPDPAGGLAQAEPVATLRTLAEDDPVVERSLRIIDPSNGGRLVTVIELLSPSNKAPPGTYTAREYDKKRQEYLDADVSLVEIDLLRGGHRFFPYRESPHRLVTAADYAACIAKAWRPGDFDLYAFDLRVPLPGLRIPLRKQDDPAILNLQALIQQVYTNGGYDDIDYARPLDPPLLPEDQQWAQQMIAAHQPQPG